ncbi:Tumor susceptibility gene 101 protein [Seminavis robusta]|uniref:Tumor susceptibility gene 101 protein n=1 Tax=Seminavis robusta TaxID=568900 RepID=A0A9N8EN69_9STRA|nr:Tumor susceptibility gene 101 protein [Seminavis robusta]|eukprot:Sro1210_g252760.1 Tumor susceptibility gene 101 protein (416) ;mRNA; r:17521-18768
MVSDPRVTRSLTRLGGLYRDPSRVDRDASTLLKSSVGNHLTPGIAPLVENNGEVAHCLVLQGTIAMHFRGNTYQLLVDLYLPPGYPHRPPVAYVRLTENMYLKENHMHVGSDGKVYLPYLHEWTMRTHNLVELVVAMSSVFSADPPVFTRAPSATPPPPPPATILPPVVVNDPPPPMPSHLLSSSNTSQQQQQAEAEARLAREAEEANRVMEAARKAEREEQERDQQMAAQKRWELQKKQQVKEQVLQKVLKHLQEVSMETKVQAQNYQRDQQRLNIAEEKLEKQLQLFQQAKNTLEEKSTIVEEKTVEIQEWLEMAAQAEQQNGTAQKEKSIDEVVQPVLKIHQQMLDLSAENASLTDALYFLDRCLYLGNLDCETHLKHVRQLAKRQFLARAHLMKVNQHLIRHPELGSTASF